MNKIFHLFTSIFIAGNISAAVAGEYPQGLKSQSAEGAQVYIIEPADGQVVSGDVTVKFGLSGMGIAPAGIEVDNTGHHHLLIDLPGSVLPDMNKPLPSSETVKHFGKGQTQTTIKLEPGEHTLQLLLGNYLHIPHDKPVISEKISIVVQ